ncbi:uncharacterized protein J4E88_004372 [Alternaria novae-zelandiae]|uniref:uncharacterized protein n=1 Tax=Alternaria novae-zelandiae TaxID=430562 RepID=UPI0020C2D099|nr:uncharacterized protein J4E88_004372 [Alternaria novae-zelandiae]KAI4684930.1 hypothetical protein J4E88_004372 [Alternaria novae-zelandiae]
MAPLGPPPYTAEQLQAITSQEERIRAQAELTSYITRARREKQEREERERLQSNAYSGSGYRTTSGSFNHYTPPSIPSYAPVHNPVFNPVYTPVSNTSYNPPYNKFNQRGGYGRGRGRGALGRGRGYTPYHPYARPPNAPMYTGFATDSNGTSIVTQPREAKENEDPAQAPAASTRQADAPKKIAALLMFVSIHLHRTAKLLAAWATARKETPVPSCMHMSVPPSPTRESVPTLSPPNSPVRSRSSHTPATSDAPEDDMDTAEDAHEWMMPKTGTSPKPQQFTQQADFVAFENDDE